MKNEELINHLEGLSADLRIAEKPAEAMILRIAINALGTSNVAETADLLWKIIRLQMQVDLLTVQKESAFCAGKMAGLDQAAESVKETLLGPAPNWPDRID